MALITNSALPEHEAESSLQEFAKLKPATFPIEAVARDEDKDNTQRALTNSDSWRVSKS